MKVCDCCKCNVTEGSDNEVKAELLIRFFDSWRDSIFVFCSEKCLFEFVANISTKREKEKEARG